jgi:hypothetical protein
MARGRRLSREHELHKVCAGSNMLDRPWVCLLAHGQLPFDQRGRKSEASVLQDVSCLSQGVYVYSLGMGSFRRIASWGDLPTQTLAVVRESYELDFKSHVNPDARGEHAKDMAAFANAFGGTIVVGAAENGNVLDYHGLPPDEAEHIATGYDLAHRDWLSPKPRIDIHLFPCLNANRVMVAVNVEPVPGQVIGAAAYRRDGSMGDKSTGWRFPYRVGRDTDWLRPEQLPMMMDPITRRTAILLEAIPVAHRKEVQIECWYEYVPGGKPSVYRVRHEGVDLMANVFKVVSTEHGVHAHMRIPLDDVSAVWEMAPEAWRVRVNGLFVRDESQFRSYEYQSVPRTMPRR